MLEKEESRDFPQWFSQDVMTEDQTLDSLISVRALRPLRHSGLLEKSQVTIKTFIETFSALFFILVTRGVTIQLR